MVGTASAARSAVVWMAGIAMLLAAACSELDHVGPGPGNPGTYVGTYSLSTAAGAPLPAVVFNDTVGDDDDRFHLRVVATEGRLEVKADGRYDQRVRHDVYIDGVLAARPLWTDRGPYQVGVSAIRFESDQVQNVSFTGIRGPYRLDVVYDHAGEGTPVNYRYIRN